jgi:hypothetical protein
MLAEPLTGTTHPRRCLLDHAAELQGALAELADNHVQVQVAPPALERADTVWELNEEH